MSGKVGPETRLIKKMRDASRPVYGSRLVVWKNHGSEMSEAGLSDLTGMLDGVALACEVKAPESYGNNVERALLKGPTIKQRAFIARVNESGGYGWFAATVDQWMEGLAYINQFAVTRWEE